MKAERVKDEPDRLIREWLNPKRVPTEEEIKIEDWPVNNDIHQHLADYVAEHELTEDQKAQWARLNKLAAEHIKDLEEMGYRVRIPEERQGKAVA